MESGHNRPALRLVTMEGDGGGLHVGVTLDAEQAAFVRVMMRERDVVGYEDIVLNVFEAGMRALGETAATPGLSG